jgi:hypothetical protein
MNPVSTLYHIAPCCFVFLFLPFTYIELPKIMNDPNVKINVPLLLASAAVAFGEWRITIYHGQRTCLRSSGNAVLPSRVTSPHWFLYIIAMRSAPAHVGILLPFIGSRCIPDVDSPNVVSPA